MLRGHAEALAPMVERVMAQAGMTFRSLERIAVTTGPGTFTGQRVGLAFARAMAVALKIPAVGTTTLEAMAAEALNRSDAAAWALAAADAKREEIYLAAAGNEGQLLIAPQLVAIEHLGAAISELAESFGRAPVLAGTAVPAVQRRLLNLGYNPVDTGVRQPTAAFVAIACERLKESGRVRPLYLRPPDAKLPGAQS